MYLFSLVIRFEEVVYLRPIPGGGSRKAKGAIPIGKEADMIQRRIRVVKWLNSTPALGVCNLCSREFKVPMNALKRTADAQASLQEQFDRHKCQYLDSSEVVARQEPDEEDDEEEDDRKEDDEDDDEGDGYSE